MKDYPSGWRKDGTSLIHTTAIIYPDVKIGENVVIGPYSIIGGQPEHREHYDGEKEAKGVIIKNGARIFEFVTVHAGTRCPTEVGEGAAIFNKAHVGHDCIIESNVTIGGQVSLAGHTYVMEGANVSGKSCTVQRCVIGAYAFVGGFTFITRDVPCGDRVLGYPARFVGPNEVGLKRANLDYERCQLLYGRRYQELVDAKT